MRRWWRRFRWEAREPLPYLLPGLPLYQTAEDWKKFIAIHDEWKAQEPK